MRELVETIRESIRSQNGVSLAQAAHSLKTASANVGATHVAELCRRLEIMGREEDFSDTKDVYQALESEHDGVCQALHREVAEVGA